MEAVQDAVSNVARYDPNDAAEALLAGDLARYVRVIEGLRGEGEAPTFLLFAAVLRALFALARAVRARCSTGALQARGARRRRGATPPRSSRRRSRTPPRSTAPSRASAPASRGRSSSGLG